MVQRCFNPSVGMAGVQALPRLAPGCLIRHVSIPQSGWRGFKHKDNHAHDHNRTVSIPQSGWRGFKRADALTESTDMDVSIPQSGWRGFKPIDRLMVAECAYSFNPSVGMAGVQADSDQRSDRSIVKFQSLSRDGGGSSSIRSSYRRSCSRVSIPQSGWRGFKHECNDQVAWPCVQVSIPQSGWRGFKLVNGVDLEQLHISFNPSVGMAGVQAVCRRVPAMRIGQVSIPQSGWRGFKLQQASYQRRQIGMFQSLSRDGGGSSVIMRGSCE